VRVTPEYVNQLAEEMRTNHSAIKAAWARTNAAAANAASIRTWEDPMVDLGGMAAEETMRAEDGDIIYGVEQKLPLFGKPKAERKAARAELATEMANAEYRTQFLRSELAKTLFRAALADIVVEVGKKDLGWLDAMVQTMDARYRSGQSTLVETLQVQNERARRATTLENDIARLSSTRVALNRFLNRNQNAAWPKLQLPEVATPVVFNQKLVDFALRYEPRSEVKRREILQADAEVELAKRRSRPDVSAGVEARNYSGDGEFRQGMFFLRMSLPWLNHSKYRHDVIREEARKQAAQLELADYEQDLRQELFQLTVGIASARREAVLYAREIIPRSESALASARAGWESGRNMFRDLLEARRMLVEARLMHAKAIAEQYEMLSELVLCCGLGDLEALQMLATPEDTQSNIQSDEK
jgi:outer membrane protein TolC